jgi:hypothetical protein
MHPQIMMGLLGGALAPMHFTWKVQILASIRSFSVGCVKIFALRALSSAG